MRNPRVESEEDIPLGHAVFVIRMSGGGAEMIPDLMTFQVDGKLYNTDELEDDSLEDEMFSALDHLRFLLKSKVEERHS